MSNNSSSDNDKGNNNKQKSTPINKMTPGSQGRKWRQDTANFSEESNSKNKE